MRVRSKLAASWATWPLLTRIRFDGASLTLVRNGGANGEDTFSATGTLAVLTEAGEESGTAPEAADAGAPDDAVVEVEVTEVGSAPGALSAVSGRLVPVEAVSRIVVDARLVEAGGELLAVDTELNAQGLEVLLVRREKA